MATARARLLLRSFVFGFFTVILAVEGVARASTGPVLTVPVSRPELGLSCYAAILMEWQSGKILYHRNGFTRMHPASLTKIMTALIALERGRLEEVVQVSEEAASQPGSTMYLREGDKFTLEDLLYGLMLNSGNDAAWAIAEHIGNGDPREFFRMMNQRARQLGAINTRFSNPHGLTDPNHYTTAFDLALITRTALKHPFFKNLVATKEKDVIDARGDKTISLYNTNKLLWLYLGTDGVKTGTTEAAGQCLVASATRNGMRLLAVVLASGDRWSDAAILFDYGFSQWRTEKILDAGERVTTVPVRGGIKAAVPLVLEDDIVVCVPRFSTGLRVELDIPEKVRAPVARGAIVGRATAYLGSEPLVSVNLLAEEWVQTLTPLTLLAHAGALISKLLISFSLY
ncbi:MAG TPA: D-alanyl-D-alanine carboxypeptidase [Firmicutes bacterium]|nr:D-alanyl-D-alanine carboxypeptidase [Candidatus Fermentithermobacillaceae bacterium]